MSRRMITVAAPALGQHAICATAITTPPLRMITVEGPALGQHAGPTRHLRHSDHHASITCTNRPAGQQWRVATNCDHGDD